MISLGKCAPLKLIIGFSVVKIRALSLISEKFATQPTSSLIAHRRPRADSDPVIWAVHVLADQQSGDGLQYETDRARFIGRGQSLRTPIAVMDGRPLSNTVGNVLDPIFNLRKRVRIASGATVHQTFTTLVADSRKAALELTDKYRNPLTWDRVSALAWTHAHVQLHHLRTKPDEAQLFQYLANRLLYADPSLRASGRLMQMNTLNVTGLWQHGISGDKPIVLLRVAEPEDRPIVEQLLRAHEYWRIKGLAVDLVILNKKLLSYVEDLQNLLQSLLRENQARSAHQEFDNSGAIFVLRGDELSHEERRLLQTASRAVLVSNRGTLAEQLLRHARTAAAFVAPKLLPVNTDAEAVAHYLKVSGEVGVLDESLPFLNGAVLSPEQDDLYFEPTASQQQASLFEHCARTLDISLATGAHGLPLMGSGDWNDGMNRVGNLGKGESVWLAWFLIATLDEFVPLALARGEIERAKRWQEHAAQLKRAVEADGWDGAWYRRAYFDDGSPLGSATNAECRIDAIAQSWGVISGAADTERAQQAMHSVREYLVRYGDDCVPRRSTGGRSPPCSYAA